MNILIQCNSKNYSEIEMLIYSTTQFNYRTNWYVEVTNDISEKQKRKLQRIVKYLDFYSNIIFIPHEEKSLDLRFPYLEDLLCLNSSVISCMPIEPYYDEWFRSRIPVITNYHAKGNKAIIFLNLQLCRMNNFHPILKDDFVLDFIGAKPIVSTLDPTFGYCEDFFAPVEPKMYYLDENHPRLIDVDENYWCRIYAQFSYIIERLRLIDTINF